MLPPLVVGSVVEEEYVSVDRAPVTAAGGTGILTGASSVQSLKLVVSAPVSAKPRVVARAMGKQPPKHETKAGIETWMYRMQDVVVETEPNTPADVALVPHVLITTIPTWAAFARDRATEIDRQIAAGPIPWPSELAKTATPVQILAWFRAHVRATNVSLDEGPLVPVTPAETIKRGTADDLSLATALVAMYRQAGHTADVAYTSYGGGPDADPTAPAFDFDRAIVRVRDAAQVLWVAPAWTSYPAGLLPSALQGRHAVVIAADTTALTDLPKLAVADNVVREVRTYEAAEADGAHVAMQRTMTGVMAAASRENMSDLTADEIRKQFADHEKQTFAVDALDHLSVPDPADPDAPWTVTADASRSGRVYTTRDQLEISVSPATLSASLPDAISPSAESHVARKHDFVWPAPHVIEIVNEIAVPEGFEMPAIADRTLDGGACIVTETQRIRGRTLTITYRLETGKPRLTPAEVEATYKALSALRQQREHINLDNTAHKLVRQGKVRDALAELQRLIKLHPKHGRHHSDLAEAYAMVGMMATARREAKRAIELEPTNADLYVMLGWVLGFDDAGLRFGKGYDAAGARAAFEKAHKLDPKHVGAAIELATLLDRDAEGKFHRPKADPKPAVAAWHEAFVLDDSEKNLDSYVSALIWATQYSDAEAVVRKRPASEHRDAMLVTVVTAGQGAPAGLRAAAGLTTDRKKAISAAAASMVLLRKYDEARALYAESGTPSQFATVLEKLKRFDKPLDRMTPDGAAIEALVDKTQPDGPATGFGDATTASETGRELLRGFQSIVKTRTLSPEFIADSVRSTVIAKVEGDANVWHVQLESNAGKLPGGPVFVAADRGVPKVIGFVGDDSERGLGRHVLRLVAKNQLAAAIRLLDWTAAEHPRNAAFTLAWGTGHGTDRDAVELAGAVLAGHTDPKALPLVLACKVTSIGQACAQTVIEIYEHRGAWNELVAYFTANPTYPFSTHTRLLAECHLGDCKDAIAEMDTNTLVKDPDNKADQYLRIKFALGNKDDADAVKRALAITKRADVTASDHNELAWLELVTLGDLTVGLASAREAARLAPNSEEIHQTLAAIEAEQGDVSQAYRDDETAMQLRVPAGPASGDWYVLGRIAEQLGLRDDALALYRRVTKPAKKGFIPESYDLAQRRLAALKP
ncbi:MAG: tetratricopeptide repeat protein [Kofleriaceae bacterium]